MGTITKEQAVQTLKSLINQLQKQINEIKFEERHASFISDKEQIKAWKTSIRRKERQILKLNLLPVGSIVGKY